MGKKKSDFLTLATAPSGSTYDYVSNGTNYKQTDQDLFQEVANYLGVGLIEPKFIGGDAYELTSDDTGYFLVFNSPVTSVLSIPDDLPIGVNAYYTNIGSGSVMVSTVSDTVRGETLVGDADGYAQIIKITGSVWQTSERPPSGGSSNLFVSVNLPHTITNEDAVDCLTVGDITLPDSSIGKPVRIYAASGAVNVLTQGIDTTTQAVIAGGNAATFIPFGTRWTAL